MHRRTAKRLHDAYRAILHIQSFVSNRTFAEYLRDIYFQSAVERQFEIVSEALRFAERDEPDLRDSLLELPVVVGLRNRIATSMTRSIIRF
jgi:uncharacterized protein with HEPN domain